VDFLHNGLIAQLAPLDQKSLLQKASTISFAAGDVLGQVQGRDPDIYFLTKGSVALFVCKNEHDISSGLAVGLVGSEGALGLQMALGFGAGNLSYIAQSPGQAYAVRGALAMRLVRRKSALMLAFANYLWHEYEGLTQFAAMSHNEDIRLRLAHWLLLSAQRCAPDALVLTHSQIAHMLGVRRVSITLAAREMKLMGLIGYSRGRIELKDIDKLQQLASA
jgi:CRP-like cAMP-binding protein